MIRDPFASGASPRRTKTGIPWATPPNNRTTATLVGLSNKKPDAFRCLLDRQQLVARSFGPGFHIRRGRRVIRKNLQHLARDQLVDRLFGLDDGNGAIKPDAIESIVGLEIVHQLSSNPHVSRNPTAGSETDEEDRLSQPTFSNRL